MFWYECTSHQTLYSKVYWGNFIIRDNLEAVQIIGRNRDRFWEEYRIKSVLSHRPDWVLNESRIIIPSINEKINEYRRDHVEYYRDILGNIVTLFSNNDSNPNKTLLNANGYNEYIQLYSDGATTFIKILPKKMNGVILTL